MKWIDLFQALNKQANEIKNIGKFNWQDRIIIYDASSGKEYLCDNFYMRHNKRPVLSINRDKIS